jgi:hypothetical protein
MAEICEPSQISSPTTSRPGQSVAQTDIDLSELADAEAEVRAKPGDQAPSK